MKKSVLFLLFFVLLLAPVVSAEISLTQPSSLYSAGDSFRINITLSSSSPTTSFLSVSLSCSQSENSSSNVEIYKSPYILKANDKRIISISTYLSSAIIGSLNGDCSINASYGSQYSSSRSFTLSRDIEVFSQIEGFEFSPEDTVKISGTAKKKNSSPLEGYIDLSVPGLGISQTSKVSNGKFSLSFPIGKTSPPGTYSVNITAYEKDDSGEVINLGRSSEDIKIKEIKGSLGIALSSQSLSPGSDFSYYIIIYNQASQEISSDVIVKIYDPSKNLANEALVKSGVKNSFVSQTDSLPGTWTIEADVDSISYKKSFTIESLELISYRLENNTLIIKNDGNVPYNRPVEISIGDTKNIEKVNLDVGEEQKYVLSAPSGEYQIGINDGTESKALGVAPLTGSAISVDSVSEGLFGSGAVSIIFWVILIILLLAVIVFLFRKISVSKKKLEGMKNRAIRVNLPEKSLASQSMSSTISSGERQVSMIVSLKIKNLSSIENDSSILSVIDSALLKAKESRAKIYVSGNYKIMIFAPVFTSEADNSVRSVNSAKQIKEILDEYNRSRALKIDFGIGVSSGELIIEKSGDKFKFVSVGNPISLAKRLSESSVGPILISKEVHDKTAGKIKSEKTSFNSWKVLDLKSKYPYDEFIKRFEKRARESK